MNDSTSDYYIYHTVSTWVNKCVDICLQLWPVKLLEPVEIVLNKCANMKNKTSTRLSPSVKCDIINMINMMFLEIIILLP